MAIFVGVHPGGVNRFAVCTLYFDGKLPALLLGVHSYSAVNEVVSDILGVFGEWGELGALAIDAPLTWSGDRKGVREADEEIKDILPKWAPNSWLRSPNALPGAVAVQGPALTWALAYEQKKGLLPSHQVYETHPRASLSQFARDMRKDIVGYRDTHKNAKAQRKHAARLVDRIRTCGLFREEGEPPTHAEHLDALVASLAALGAAKPETGIVLGLLEGSDIRPVGRRSVAIVKALP